MYYNQVPAAESFRGKRRLLLGLLGIGTAALLTTLLAGFLAPAGSEVRHQFAFSWLFAFLYFFTILIGCFFGSSFIIRLILVGEPWYAAKWKT